MHRRGGDDAHVSALDFVERPARLPLSCAQERLWVLDKLGAGAIYNISAALRLRGLLDVEALEAAFNELLHRHEALRTRIEVSEGELCQVVDAPRRFKLPVVDLSSLNDADRTIRVDEIAAAEARTSFDLAGELLMRARLLRLGRTSTSL